MYIKPLFALATLALASSAVLADEVPGGPLTRTEVTQSVLAARAAGTLAPAGQAYDGPPARTVAGAPLQSRAATKADVLQARAAGTLAHAGSVAPEEEVAYARAHPSTSILTRAEVKAEVLQARAQEQLVPAGEAVYSTMAAPIAPTRTALRFGKSAARNGTN